MQNLNCLIFVFALLSPALCAGSASYSSHRKCSYAACFTYNPDENLCYSAATDASLYTSYKFAVCPAGTYCDYNLIRGATQLFCQPAKEAGDACTSYMQCKSQMCVNGKCSTRRARFGETVQKSTECNQGLFMSSASEKCTRQISAGFACDSGSVYYSCKGRLVCNGGYCWQPMSLANGAAAQNYQVCKSLYINKTAGQCAVAPKLIGVGTNGMKGCSVDTVDTDCRYAVGDNIVSASSLNKTCACTRYSSSVRYYCELGEGDDLFISNFKQYLTFLETDVRGMSKLSWASRFSDPVSYIQQYDELPCAPYYSATSAGEKVGAVLAVAIVLVLAIV